MRGILILILFFVPVISIAQVEEEPDYSYEEIQTYIFVDNIQLSKNEYKPGETINGSFEIFNTDTKIISNLRYRVELVYLTETEGALHPSEPIYTSSLSEPINNIPAEGIVAVEFSYKSPEIIPEGRLGILIQTYTGNENQSAYDISEIEFKGERKNFIGRSSFIVVNETEVFDTLSGPTVEKDEKVELYVILSNTSEDDKNITTELKIFEGSNTNNEPIFSSLLSPINVKAGEQTDIFTELKIKEYSPGVYTIVFSFKDELNQEIALPIESRIIVAGLKPKIEEVKYSSTDLTDKEFFEVNISYMDIPYDFRVDENNEPKDSRADSVNSEKGVSLDGMSGKISIKNISDGRIVAQKDFVFESGADAIVPIDSFFNASETEVFVELFQNGQKVDEYIEQVSFKTNEYGLFEKYFKLYPLQSIVVSGIIILIIISIILSLIFRRKTYE